MCMCICMCMCMYWYMYSTKTLDQIPCAHLRVHVWIHACIHIYIYIPCMYTYTRAYFMLTDITICTHKKDAQNVHSCMFALTRHNDSLKLIFSLYRVLMSIHPHMTLYIHTYIHTYIRQQCPSSTFSCGKCTCRKGST